MYRPYVKTSSVLLVVGSVCSGPLYMYYLYVYLSKNDAYCRNKQPCVCHRIFIYILTIQFS